MIEPETNVYVFAVFGLLIFPENYQPNQIDLVDDYLRWRLDNALSAKILIGIQKICLILNDCQVPLVNPLSLKGIFSRRDLCKLEISTRRRVDGHLQASANRDDWSSFYWKFTGPP